MDIPDSITELHDETLMALLPSDASESQKADRSQSFYAGAAAVVCLVDKWREDPTRDRKWRVMIEEMQASQFTQKYRAPA